MAKIPVERTSGGGWWKWLLGLLLLALVAWLVFEALEPDDDVDGLAVGDTVGVVEMDTEPLADGPITDVTTLFTAADRRALVGRQVELAGMHVLDVVGDSVFYVSPTPGTAVEPGNRVIIAGLDEVIPSPPPDVEGRYDVTAGQVVTLYGTVEAIAQEQPAAWGITEQEAGDMLARDQIYVRVQRLEITQQANQ